MNQHNAPKELKKLYWQSRRGMLELDLLLIPFTREAYATLPPGQQIEYRQLLSSEDQDLHAWLLRRKPAGERQHLIERILAHNTAKKGNAD